MGLKEGTLQPLVERGCSIPIDNLCETALHHMLQALDFLAVNHIIHRDLKPENILYVSQRGQYQFQLGDFGLSNRQFIATTFAGSLLYMAPEIIQQGSQTPKVDIWSLYVTILWTLDVKGFRDGWRTLQGYDDIQRAILLASKADSVSIVQEMARPDPEKRASAAQMLIKLFGGKRAHNSARSDPTPHSPRRGRWRSSSHGCPHADEFNAAIFGRRRNADEFSYGRHHAAEYSTAISGRCPVEDMSSCGRRPLPHLEE